MFRKALTYCIWFISLNLLLIDNSSPPVFFPMICRGNRVICSMEFPIFWVCFILFIFLSNFLLSWCFFFNFLEALYLLGICDKCCRYLCPVCHLPFYFPYDSSGCCEMFKCISSFSTIFSHFCASHFISLHSTFVFIPLNCIYTSIIFQMQMISFDSQPWKMRNFTYTLLPYQLCKLHCFCVVSVCNICIFFLWR